MAAASPPKTPHVRIFVAGDDEVIPDWKKMRLTAQVPLNMPIRPYLERLLTSRLKWENLDGVRFVTAEGSNLANLEPTSDLFQVNLSPKQLGMEADSYRWAWAQHSTAADAPLLTPFEATKARLSRFYQYYAPEKSEREIIALMQDFQDNYDLMFVQLVGKYGQEPTPEMLYRKRIAPAKSAKAGRRAEDPAAAAAAAAAVSGGRPGAATVAGGSKSATSRHLMPAVGPSTLEDQDLAGIATLLSRTSTVLLHITYLKKWIQWLRQRRDSKRIVSFMSGNIESFLRAQAFNRWKRYAELNKTRRQLSVSTKLAFKQESVVGGLAEENSVLKQDVRKLNAQVEVLQANNSRRLESLFSSSESAIIQMKLLTSELQAKERTIGALESKLMSVGNKMLEAKERADTVTKQLEEMTKDRDESVLMLQTKIEELEAEGLLLRERMERMRPRTPPEVCRHCPHYQLVVSEADALKTHCKNLLERLDASEAERRSLADRVQMLEAGSPPGGRGDVDVGSSFGGRSSHSMSPPRPQTTDPSGGGRRGSFAPSEIPPPASSAGGGGSLPYDPAGTRRPSTTHAPSALRQADGFEGFGPLDTTSAARNVSFSLPPPAHRDDASDATSAPPSTMGLMTPSHPPFRAPEERPTLRVEQPQSLPPRIGTEVNLSMSNFFTREDSIGNERVRLSMDRQTTSRYGNTSVARNRGAPPLPSSTGSLAPHGIGRYKVAAPDGRGGSAPPPAAPGPSLATAAAIPGLPGTAPITLDPSRMITHMHLRQALDDAPATRPRSNPLHGQFETGPTAGAAAMRNQLFAFHQEQPRPKPNFAMH